MSELKNFYKHHFNFNDFYEIIKHGNIKAQNNVTEFKDEYISSDRFLFGIEGCLKEFSHNHTGEKLSIVTRVDIPVWFGDIKSAKMKVLVYGREPRDTDSRFNVELVDDIAFATPFGVDRWNEKSSIKHKPQLRYFRVFQNMIENEKLFVMFSDVVKTYNSTKRKPDDDNFAQKMFFDRAKKSLSLTTEEIYFINPDLIIALGNDAYRFLNESFKKKTIEKVRHPAQGGEADASRHIKDILSRLL